MALIICNECKKEISDKSLRCIHCGCPVEYGISNKSLENINKNTAEDIDIENDFKTKLTDEFSEADEKKSNSWYDLSDGEQKQLMTLFSKKTGKKRLSTFWQIFISVFLGGMNIFNFIFIFLSAFSEEFSEELCIVLGFCVGVITCFISLICFSIEDKNYDKKFSSWLEKSKGIYK